MAEQTKKEKKPTISLNAEQLKSLVKEIEASNLSASSKSLVLTILTTFAQVQLLLAKKKLGILTLLRQIFGHKTESRKNGDKNKEVPSSSEPPPKKKD